MSKLRKAAQAVEDELRNQHKAFASWFLGLHATTTLDPEDLAWSAWKAALAAPENRPCTCHPDDNPPQPCAQRYALTECKALAQPETTADPVMWMNRYDATMKTRDRVTANAMGFTIPLYTHPPRDEWRPASEPPEDLRGRVIAWRHPPQRQGGAWIEALYDDGAWVTRDGIAHDITHWRDVQPPTEGAK